MSSTQITLIQPPRKKTKAIVKATYSQATLRFYVHNSQHSFIENGISHIFTCFCISGNLEKGNKITPTNSKQIPLVLLRRTGSESNQPLQNSTTLVNMHLFQ